MGNIIVGKRVPIGAAVNGIIIFVAWWYNLQNPDAPISIAAAGGLSTTLTVIVQIWVANKLGVTTK